jgi:hypothetical protein
MAGRALAGSLTGVVSVLLLAACAREEPPEESVAKPPDISGFWELREELPQVPRGSVTAEAAAHAQELQKARGVFSPEVRWCRYIGVPFFYGMSPPISIVQGEREVVISGETLSAPQHVYLNRNFPDMEIFDPTSNGFSVGHYEGDTLVVETRGFSEVSGNPWIPGGGYKTYDTRLTQRFKLIENGEKLSVTFTWVDPKVFAGPHTYEFVYFRSPPGTYAQEFSCDASDPAFGAGVVEPKQ